MKPAITWTHAICLSVMSAHPLSSLSIWHWRQLQLPGRRHSEKWPSDFALTARPDINSKGPQFATKPPNSRLGVYMALREHRKRQIEERLAWGAGYVESGLVFTREDGSLIHPERFSRWFAAHSRNAGLPKIRFHDLRHTHATLALQAGVHPKVVQERLGHSSITVTLDTYSHAIPSMHEQAAEEVARLVMGE